MSPLAKVTLLPLNHTWRGNDRKSPVYCKLLTRLCRVEIETVKRFINIFCFSFVTVSIAIRLEFKFGAVLGQEI